MTKAHGPIFVVGPSRSGTAMIRSLLNNHDDVYLAGETHYFDDLRARFADHIDIPLDGADRERCEDYFLALAHRPYGHGGEPDKSPIPRAELREQAESLGGTADAYFEAYCRLNACGAARWGEKTPRHIFRLRELLTRYPDAQAICMVRDPRAVVASYRDWKNQGGFDFDADPGHRETLAEDEARSRQSYDPAIATMLWRSTVGAGLEALDRFGSDRVRIQRYEDFVSDPDKAARDLTSWLGLDYAEELLEVPLHNSSVSAYAADAGVSQAPVERWRERLSAADISVVEWFSGGTLGAAGYRTESGARAWLSIAGAYVRLPIAVWRAAKANRARIPNLPAYVARRVTLMLKSR